MHKQGYGTFIDSCVLLDIFTDDPVWVSWSLKHLRSAAMNGPLIINTIVYAEISIGFSRIETLDEILAETGIEIRELPRSAAFLAGKAYKAYRSRGGKRSAPLPDFFIGAHAAVLGVPLITRDPKRMRQVFSGLNLVYPER